MSDDGAAIVWQFVESEEFATLRSYFAGNISGMVAFLKDSIGHEQLDAQLSYFQIIGARLVQEDPNAALPFFEESLKLAETIARPDAVSDNHHNLGEALRSLGRSEEAITHLAAACQWNENNGLTANLREDCRLLSELCQESGNIERATEWRIKANSLTDDNAESLAGQLRLGHLQWLQHDFAAALETFSQAAELASLEQPDSKASALLGKGLSLKGLKRTEEAVTALKESGATASDSRDGLEIRKRAFATIATLLLSEERPDNQPSESQRNEGFEYIRRCLEIQATTEGSEAHFALQILHSEKEGFIDDAKSEIYAKRYFDAAAAEGRADDAVSLALNAAKAALFSGSLERGLTWLSDAENLLPAATSRAKALELLELKAHFLRLAGHFQEAIDTADTAIGLTEEADSLRRSELYAERGEGYFGLARFESAFRDFSLAADEAGRASPTPKETLLLHIRRAVALASVGDIRGSFAILKEFGGELLGEEEWEANYALFNTLGLLHYVTARHEGACELLANALKVLEFVDPAGWLESSKRHLAMLEMQATTNLGAALISAGEYAPALELLKNAHRKFHRGKLKVSPSKVVVNLGVAEAKMGLLEPAIGHLEEALQLVREDGDLESAAKAHYQLAALAERKGILSVALEHSKAAVRVQEQSLMGFRLPSSVQSFGAVAADYYRQAVRLHLLAGEEEIAAALELAESAKSRSLGLLLKSTDLRRRDESDHFASLLQQERHCLDELRRAGFAHSGLGSGIGGNQIFSVADRLDEIYAEMAASDPQYVELRRGRPANPAAIRELLGQQAVHCVAVEIFDLGSEVALFVVRPDRDRIEVVKTGVPEKLYQQIQGGELHDRFAGAQRGEEREDGELLSEVAQVLLLPIADLLSGADLIYFVPYGVFYNFPFHCLLLKGEPLICTAAVAYAPSLSVLQILLSADAIPQDGARRLEAFGTNPHDDLDLESEPRAIAQAFGGVSVLGQQATSARLFTSEADVVHLTCHGSYESQDPLESCILLADGRLTAKAFFSAQLKPRLLTVAACRSGFNQVRTGDEVVGLLRALLATGVRTVVVSQWNVNSRATEELMKLFYHQLRSGRSSAAALQFAQMRLRENPEFRSPAYWAPFVLFGDWR